MHLCTTFILLLILPLVLSLFCILYALWYSGKEVTSALDLQYGYHKEHKAVSYAMTLHSRFSITLMHHQIHDPWG